MSLLNKSSTQSSEFPSCTWHVDTTMAILLIKISMLPKLCVKRDPRHIPTETRTCTHGNPEISTCSPRNPICLCTFLCLIGKSRDKGRVASGGETMPRDPKRVLIPGTKGGGQGRVARR